MLGKFSTLISSKIFSYPFFLFFWDPHNSNYGMFDMVSEVFQTIHNFLNSFLLYSTLHKLFPPFYLPALLSISDSDILVLIPSRVVLISVIVLFVSVCLFFNSSRSLLIDSCIFSIFFSKFLIIFTIIIMNSSSGSLPISSSFIWTSVFLVCSFNCAVFLCLLIFFF